MTAPHTQSQPDIVAMARAAQHDDRLADGALYGKLADRIEELTKALETAHEAIKSLPEEALGYGTVEHTDGSGIAYQYPIRSEVMASIEAVLDAEGSVAMPLEDRS